MNTQAGFGLMMMFVAFVVISLSIIFFYQTAIVPQIQSGTEELTTLTSGQIGMIKAATSACQMWRSPQSYYDPAALSASMVESINSLFPIECSQENPLACERACACLIKLSKYCKIGQSGSSADACLSEPCRLGLVI